MGVMKIARHQKPAAETNGASNNVLAKVAFQSPPCVLLRASVRKKVFVREMPRRSAIVRPPSQKTASKVACARHKVAAHTS